MCTKIQRMSRSRSGWWPLLGTTSSSDRPDYRGSSGVTFAFECGEIGGCVGVIDLFEVEADAVGVVHEG